MFANLLIDNTVPTLSLDDTVERALSIMQTNLLQRIPILDQENKYLGNVKEEDLLDIENIDETLISFLEEKLPLSSNEHFLNILRNQHFIKDGFLAIVDQDLQFVGVVTHHSAIDFLGKDRSIEMIGN